MNDFLGGGAMVCLVVIAVCLISIADDLYAIRKQLQR